MKKIFPIIILFLFFFSNQEISAQNNFRQIPPFLNNEQAKNETSKTIEKQVIVKFKKNESPDELKIRSQKTAADFFGRTYKTDDAKKAEEKLKKISEINSKAKTSSYKKIFPSKKDSLKNYYVFQSSRLKPEELIKLYKSLPNVEFAQANYILRSQNIPNDYYYNYQWYFKKTEMEKAWDIATGSNEIIVSVVDSGIDYNHEDFREIIKGRNFINYNNDPMDDNGHGTMVAGIIGAFTNNSKGVAGANWNIRLMAVKVTDFNGEGTSETTANGIIYSADQGAKVINVSIAGKLNPGETCSDSDFLGQEAINYALQKGAVVIVAAGNGGSDAFNYSPVSCNGTVRVGATNNDDRRASYSNFGEIIDLSAPGGEDPEKCMTPSSPFLCIISNYLNNEYALSYGTSFASPQVSAVAALLLSKNPNLKSEEIKDILKRTSDNITTDLPIGGRLNAQKALEEISEPATNLTPSPTDFFTPSPTLTIEPSPAGNTFVSLDISLTGIGLLGNSKPLNKEKNFTLCFYDPFVDATNDNSCDKAVLRRSGKLTYDTIAGNFINESFHIGDIQTGEYKILIKGDRYLRKSFGEIIFIEPEDVNKIPKITLTAGDINNDNLLNIVDYNIYISCFWLNANSQSCKFKEAADLNDDGKVDSPTELNDYRILFDSFQTRQGD